MKIIDLTYLNRLKKFFRFLILFVILLVIKSIFEDTFYYGFVEDLKDKLWIGIILAIGVGVDVSRTKIVIKKIENNDERDRALKWVEQYFEKNNAMVIYKKETERIYLSENNKGRFLKKKRKEFYSVEINDKKIWIEGPYNFNPN
ncbi:hypothetical protein DIS07_13890 [Polaribacter aquimarinus]|uniref:Uncharacterized protein n=1 Tax=Polaribacter aquimarinus TaxID=2100726 RepID=A0A2U2J825_9FLAO|nr:hypothetical protein DIS07_13890 [Polaribacter aquimarinus]